MTGRDTRGESGSRSPRGARVCLRAGAVALALASLWAPLGPAHAQHAAVALDRLRPAELADDGMALRSAMPLRHLEPSVGLSLVYGNDPLVFEARLGDPESAFRVVSHQLTGHLALGLGFYERVTLVADIPFNLLMSGDDAAARRLGLAPGEAFGVGDPLLAGRVRLTEGGAVTLALNLGLTFPVAQAQDPAQTWAGEATVTGRPELLMDVRSGPFVAMLNLGAVVRGDTVVEGLTLGSELTYGVGLGARLLDGQLGIHAELVGATVMSDVGRRETSPLEALLGARYTMPGGLSLSAAAGPGLRPGLGAPDARVMVSLSWPSSASDPELDELRRQLDEERRRRGGDGGLSTPPDGAGDPDPPDAGSNELPDATPDADNDGITGPADLCPEEAEDYDMFEDDDGCEDPDNDGDAIPDIDDLCPQDPEDFDIFEDDDGCPDPDNDGDGIDDVDDLCPVEPGPVESEGCPPSGSW